jgi:hypothetical protein
VLFAYLKVADTTGELGTLSETKRDAIVLFVTVG